MNGVLLVDKEQGWTSSDVVVKLKGILRQRRVGHAGTLDPMATGLLVVFAGRATRAVQFAEADEKRYLASLRLGLVTDTQDIWGTVLSESPVSVTEDALRAVLPRFTGEIEQIPPMYSAIKVQGKKLYDLARKGVEVERKARRVTIYELELLPRDEDGDWGLRVVCSKGTYIRTLCHDLGAALGCGGCMAALTRTMAAGFTLDEAVSIDDAQEQGGKLLRPVDSLFRQYPAYRIDYAEAERRCRCGNPIRAFNSKDGMYRVYGQDGTFLALSRCENGVLTSIKNFFST